MSRISPEQRYLELSAAPSPVQAGLSEVVLMLFTLKTRTALWLFNKCFPNLQKETAALPFQVSLSPPPPRRKITMVIIIANQAPVYPEAEFLSEAALHTGKVQLSQGAFHLKHSLTWTSRVEGVVVVLF